MFRGLFPTITDAPLGRLGRFFYTDFNFQELKFPRGYVLVHKLSWGNSQYLTMHQVDPNLAYVPMDGVFFLMKRNVKR